MNSNHGLEAHATFLVWPDMIGEDQQARQDREHENNDDDRFGSVFGHRRRI
jgi:hypothetical protein